MDNMIGYCGFNCLSCNIRTATLTNDENLKRAILNKLQNLNKAPYVLPTFVDCIGCKVDNDNITEEQLEELKKSGCGGAKPHKKCEIKNCASEKGLRTCGECISYNNCTIVTTIHQY